MKGGIIFIPSLLRQRSPHHARVAKSHVSVTPVLLVIFGLGRVAYGAETFARPVLSVRVVLPRQESVGPDVAVAGTIRARVQTNVSFNTPGKVTARRVEVGEHVTAGSVLAQLDPAEQQADIGNAEASLNSAQALLHQAEITFGRQRSLISGGFTTRTSYDQAQETLSTTQAQVQAAEASLGTAREQLSYTILRAERTGIIVSRNVEVGQVVQTGQAVFTLAEDGPRDAVFNVPEALLVTPPLDLSVEIAMQSDPAIRATGTVREIAPILDAATDTVTIKVTIGTTPAGMTLGAAVTGRAHFRQDRVFVLPWSALFQAEKRPAVWLVNVDGTVALQPVTVSRYENEQVYLSGGLDGTRLIVTAGGQLLFPGQTVRTIEGTEP